MSNELYEGLIEYFDDFAQKYDIKDFNIDNDNQYYYKIIDVLKLDIQQKERQRIARDLHDTSLQNLTHLIHKIELSSLYIDEDSIKAKLELATVNKNLKQIIKEIRNIIFDLRPMSFDDLGLKEYIDNLVDKLRVNSNFEIESYVEKINCDNSLILITIFRIVEECLNNSLKHSSGNKVILALKNEKDNNCSIVIKDNGQSFEFDKIDCFDSSRHFGLCILKERVKLLSGKINIYPDPGIGTTVEIFISLLKY